MSAVARFYSSTAIKTTITGSINTTATSITLASISGYPTSFPFSIVLEKDTANEEIISVTAITGSTYTAVRAFDGTTGRTHAAGTTAEHAVSAIDYTLSRSHEAAAANVHDIGATSSVVGTLTTQTLTNKTLGGDLAAGGFKVTGLADPAANQDAATKAYVVSQTAGSVTAAAQSATDAAGSASAAAGSASAAAGSVSAAAGSASAAAGSASSAATSFDSFDDRYLGAKSSDPSTDNDGNALLTGALMFNSTANEMKVWNGSAWQLVDTASGISPSLIDAKGDLLAGTANDTVNRLAVGTDGFVLTADAAEATGLKWSASSGGGAGLQDVFFLMGA